MSSTTLASFREKDGAIRLPLATGQAQETEAEPAQPPEPETVTLPTQEPADDSIPVWDPKQGYGILFIGPNHFWVQQHGLFEPGGRKFVRWEDGWVPPLEADELEAESRNLVAEGNDLLAKAARLQSRARRLRGLPVDKETANHSAKETSNGNG